MCRHAMKPICHFLALKTPVLVKSTVSVYITHTHIHTHSPVCPRDDPTPDRNRPRAMLKSAIPDVMSPRRHGNQSEPANELDLS